MRPSCGASCRRVCRSIWCRARYAWLAALPLTANGKLDRGRCRRPEAGRAGGRSWRLRRPRRRCCAALVAELLGVERVGVGDDFFALGGHSLLAARLAARVREASGRELPLRLVFERPVLGDAGARRCAGCRGRTGRRWRRGPRPERPAAVVRAASAVVPAPAGGAGGGHLQHGAGAAAARRGSTRRRCGGRSSTCWRGTRCLRTLLVEEGGEPWQLVLPAGEAAARFAFAGRGVRRGGARARPLAASARRGFDLAHDLPLRVALSALGPDEHALLLVVQHHAPATAGRGGRCWPTWARPTRRGRRGRAPSWRRCRCSTPTTPCGSASCWGRRTTRRAGSGGSWRGGASVLAGLPEELALPADRPRPRRRAAAAGG